MIDMHFADRFYGYLLQIKEMPDGLHPGHDLLFTVFVGKLFLVRRYGSDFSFIEKVQAYAIDACDGKIGHLATILAVSFNTAALFREKGFRC